MTVADLAASEAVDSIVSFALVGSGSRPAVVMEHVLDYYTDGYAPSIPFVVDAV